VKCTFLKLKYRCKTKPNKWLFLKTHGRRGGERVRFIFFMVRNYQKSDKQISNHNVNQVIRLSKFITLIIDLKCQKIHGFTFVINHTDIKNIIYFNNFNLSKIVKKCTKWHPKCTKWHPKCTKWHPMCTKWHPMYTKWHPILNIRIVLVMKFFKVVKSFRIENIYAIVLYLYWIYV